MFNRPVRQSRCGVLVVMGLSGAKIGGGRSIDTYVRRPKNLIFVCLLLRLQNANVLHVHEIKESDSGVPGTRYYR